LDHPYLFNLAAQVQDALSEPKGGNMTTFILLSKISPLSVEQTADLAEIDTIFQEELSTALPQVKRIASYALLGSYDFMHIIEAPDELLAAKTALMVNRFGSAATQTLTAIPFEEFKKVSQDVKAIKIAHR
jgi:uncharacterized protein with GYD domain